LLKPSYGGEGVWPNRHITLAVAKKLNLHFILLHLRYMWGWLKTSYGGGVG